MLDHCMHRTLMEADVSKPYKQGQKPLQHEQTSSCCPAAPVGCHLVVQPEPVAGSGAVMILRTPLY
jgi:hypothetical protein